jgi:multiple antibiotic resistance protein
MDPTLTFGIAAFISVLAIINPVSTIAVFLTLTRKMKAHMQNVIAFRSSLAAFCVLFFFALTGFLVFQLFDITIDAFRIAGGIVIFVIGMRILFPPEHDSNEDGAGESVYLMPLAVPMASGPGAITTVVVLASQATSFGLEFVLWSAIFLACAVNFIVLRFSGGIRKAIGNNGVAVLNKIMGLIICAVGVQFVITGLISVFHVLA